MKKLLGSIKPWFIKASLRNRYASQLQRKNGLDIHTVEGWNDRVRVHHSMSLIDKGIAPTEENLAIFQEEVAESVREFQKEKPPVPIAIRQDSTEKIFRECEAAKIEKIFNETGIAFYPWELIFGVLDRMTDRKNGGRMYPLGGVYLLGYIRCSS